MRKSLAATLTAVFVEKQNGEITALFFSDEDPQDSLREKIKELKGRFLHVQHLSEEGESALVVEVFDILRSIRPSCEEKIFEKFLARIFVGGMRCGMGNRS